MSRHQEWDPMCKVYIGGLRSDSNKFDIEDAFKEFGKVKLSVLNDFVQSHIFPHELSASCRCTSTVVNFTSRVKTK